MNLVNQIDLTVALAEFVLRIYENQSLLLGNLLTTGKQLAGIVLHDLVILLADNALGNDFLARDVHVVTFVSLGGWGNDRLGETLVFLHALGQLNTTQLTTAILVLAPCRTRQDRADNHLYTETLTLQTYGNHGVGSSQFPVGADVTGSIQELGSNLVQHLSFVGNALWQNHVKGRNTVCSHHDHQVVTNVVHIAHLSVVHALLSFEVEVSFC